MKKILSFTLALCLMFSLITVTAYAYDDTTVCSCWINYDNLAYSSLMSYYNYSNQANQKLIEADQHDDSAAYWDSQATQAAIAGIYYTMIGDYESAAQALDSYNFAINNLNAEQQLATDCRSRANTLQGVADWYYSDYLKWENLKDSHDYIHCPYK